MRKISCIAILWIFACASCAIIDAPPGKAKKAPPGQVQKATGYNPASGKVKNK